MASAAPSVGSVPAPSSSNSASELGRDRYPECATMLVMCEENVESDCSMDCSSPMSANTSSKIAQLRTVGRRDLHARLRHQR